MSEKDHIITSASGYLSRTEGIKDPLTKKWISRPLYTFDQIVYRLYVPVKFLQDNELLTRKLVDGPESITEDFELRKSDLTELGYEMFRVAHSKWLGALDRKGAKAVGDTMEEIIRDAEAIRQDWLRSGKADQIFKNHLKKTKEKFLDLK